MKAYALVVATTALMLGGCPSRTCPTRPFIDPASTLTSYRDMRRPLTVLRAEARVDRRDPSQRVRGTVLMYIERDDHVRFDVMTQFGPAAVLTSDGERFALMDLRENRFFVGPTCPSNIERLLGLRFGGDEVARILLGETPRITGEHRMLPCREGRYLIEIVSREGERQEIELEVRPTDVSAPPEEQRMRLRRSELFAPDGSVRWRITYDGYHFVEDPTDQAQTRRGLVLPGTIRFEEPARGVDTEVRFGDVSLNVRPPPGAFQQQPREGLRVEEVRCD